MMLNVIVCLLSLGLVSGQGWLWMPPSRSSMWRLGFDTPRNYNGNQLSCGGYWHQWVLNHGKCGVCGDRYDGPIENQPGQDNIYALGIISATYDIGQEMDIQVDITANQMGWFEFRLCPHNDTTTAVTQECLDEYLLELADDDGTRWFLPDSGVGMQTIRVRLPNGLSCSQCVLQWKYNCGNSWGKDPNTGHECVGCGSQEQFYGCADIAVGENGVTPPNYRPTETQPTNPAIPTPSPWPPKIPDKK